MQETREAAAAAELNVQEGILDLQNAIEFANARIINREEVIEQIFCALLTAEHVLVQSRTGVGKSLMAEQIFMLFDGAACFRVQASKEQQPDTYFGALDIDELKKGNIKHNTADSLVESQFGFIDEIFDANDYTLRALLSLLNERELILGAQQQKAAIHTVIAATNYLRISDVTEAVLDRFAYQSVVYPDKEPYVQYRIAEQYMQHGGRTAVPPKRIPYHVLRRISDICTGQSSELEITIGPEIIYFANLVIHYYEELRNRSLDRQPDVLPGRDFYISPRRQMKAFDLMRAIAFMHGRTSVTQADVEKLYVLFTTIGIAEEREVWNKAYTALAHQFGATNTMEQLRTLLDFKHLLDILKADPSLMSSPITSLDALPVRRTLREWAREAFGLSDVNVENNRRLLTEFLERFQPATDEVRTLKQELQHDLWVLFQAQGHGTIFNS